MDTCHGCRHWAILNLADADEVDESADDGADRWARPDGLDDWPANWGTCTREDELDPPMYSVDGSDYFSALRTRASFGCNAWEAER